MVNVVWFMIRGVWVGWVYWVVKCKFNKVLMGVVCLVLYVWLFFFFVIFRVCV